MDIQKKLELVETFNDSRRWKEEKKLLITEMKNHLHYFSDLLRNLSEDIASTYIYVCKFIEQLCDYMCIKKVSS